MRLGAGALVALLATLATAAPGRAAFVPTPQRAAMDAYLYGIPLMEFLRTAREQTSVTAPDYASDAPVNQLGDGRQLASPINHVIVQPNNDTLYSMGHLDLRAGALVLHVPAVSRHRYYSFEFMDPYTNVFAYVGTRTTGQGPATFLITGPGWRGRVPRGLRRIRSPYRLAWIVGRTLVDGPSDLTAAHRVQDGYRLLPLRAFLRHGLSWSPPRPRKIISTPIQLREPTGIAFFDALGTALAQNPPPARDASMLSTMRSVGVGPGLHPSREHLSAAVLSALQAAAETGAAYVAQLRVSLATASVVRTHGWFVPPADTGDYGTDYQFRAVVALNGLAANRPAEAMYIIGVRDSTLQTLDGRFKYVIHFPAGQLPPARYFWSLTMYDQSFFLVANPLQRYELGDRSALKRNPDGSLDIYLQHTAPRGHLSNWLPAPASGTFEVTLRLYGPRSSALDGTYTYPPIMRQG